MSNKSSSKKERMDICVECGEYTRIPQGDLKDKDELCGNCLANQEI